MRPPAAQRPPRRILLVDADAFFVAVARLVDPDGAGRAPLLIVGGARGSRGVVCSASYECRAFGVRSGMPIARALRLCPAAESVPVPRGACSEMSRRIGDVLARFAPVVAPASIDEWYLDLAGTEGLYGHEPLATTAGRIRAAVIEATGLTVSIGGGTTRVVAKLAVELAKPHKAEPGAVVTGVHVVDAGSEAAFMLQVALADIPHIGPRFQERLARFGLRTVHDVRAHDECTIVAWLGAREGRWLWERVHGVDASRVAAREETKSTGREETFDTDLHDDVALERELLRLVVRVSADARGEGLRARTVTVKMRDADFTTRQASRTLDVAVDTERAVAAVAGPLFARLRRTRRVGVRLLGVTLSGLSSASAPQQLALFDAPVAAPPPPIGPRVAGTPASAAVASKPSQPVETERDRELSRTLDRIRAKFGAGAIVPGSMIE